MSVSFAERPYFVATRVDVVRPLKDKQSSCREISKQWYLCGLGSRFRWFLIYKCLQIRSSEERAKRFRDQEEKEGMLGKVTTKGRGSLDRAESEAEPAAIRCCRRREKERKKVPRPVMILIRVQTHALRGWRERKATQHREKRNLGKGESMCKSGSRGKGRFKGGRKDLSLPPGGKLPA